MSSSKAGRPAAWPREFFGVGCSRTVPWAQRHQAARLLAAVTSPERGFDAIIVGEPGRAFTGTRLLCLAPVFLARGVQVWLPEVDGPGDRRDPSHRVLALRRPDVVLMDIRMPQLDGLAATEQTVARPPTVVVLTRSI